MKIELSKFELDIILVALVDKVQVVNNRLKLIEKTDMKIEIQREETNEDNLFRLFHKIIGQMHQKEENMKHNEQHGDRLDRVYFGNLLYSEDPLVKESVATFWQDVEDSLSNCCNAHIIDDTDVCSECKEHCIPNKQESNEECKTCTHLIDIDKDGEEGGLCIGYEPHMIVDFDHSCKEYRPKQKDEYEYQWIYALDRDKTIFKLSSHTTQEKPDTAYYNERFELSRRVRQ